MYFVLATTDSQPCTAKDSQTHSHSRVESALHSHEQLHAPLFRQLAPLHSEPPRSPHCAAERGAASHRHSCGHSFPPPPLADAPAAAPHVLLSQRGRGVLLPVLRVAHPVRPWLLHSARTLSPAPVPTDIGGCVRLGCMRGSCTERLLCGIDLLRCSIFRVLLAFELKQRLEKPMTSSKADVRFLRRGHNMAFLALVVMSVKPKPLPGYRMLGGPCGLAEPQHDPRLSC